MSTFPQSFTSSVSHWQATNKGSSALYLHNASANPPSEADIVIIGGGIMGASLSYFLTRPGAEGEGKKVVLVEAKDIASGASGRNGGHVGPATWEAFSKSLAPLPKGTGLSVGESLRIVQQERDNLELVADIVEKEGIKEKVNFWKGMLCEVHETPEASSYAKEEHDKWQAARLRFGYHGSGDTQFITDKAEAARITRFKPSQVTSVHLRPAGSVHSHKLCTALVQLALDSKSCDYQLFSWTPVSKVEKDKGKGVWKVKTSKGVIKTKRVVLCTNAHTKNFFPEDDLLHWHIEPRFAQCSYITPPANFSGHQSLKHTYNMSDEFYQVTTADGGLVLGGGDDFLVDRGIKKAGWRNGKVDDSFVVDEWTKILDEYCPSHYDGWEQKALGEGLTRVWSGILTASKDHLPVVGAVPGKEGMFIAAGFNGHGMSRVFSVGRALAAQLKTGEWDASLLPRAFEYTQERLQRTKDAEDKYRSQGIDPEKLRWKSRMNPKGLEEQLSELQIVPEEKEEVDYSKENKVVATVEKQKDKSPWGCIVA